MGTPATTDFAISQGDTLPIMRIELPKNSDGQLIDLTNCTVTFLGRKVGDRKTPPPIIRPAESHAIETVNSVQVVAVYVHFVAADTKAITGDAEQNFIEMQGELEIKNNTTLDILTVPNDVTTPYIKWWIRDDIGDGA